MVKVWCKGLEEESVHIERLADDIILAIKNKLIIVAKGGDEISKKGEIVRYWEQWASLFIFLLTRLRLPIL